MCHWWIGEHWWIGALDMKRHFLTHWKIVALIMSVCIIAYATLFLVPPRTDGARVLGVHFARQQAEALGLDWRAAYRAILGDLGVRAVRLAAYWPSVEPSQGQWDFTDLDWMMDTAADHGATVVLAVGRRLPRWPECHVPEWARALPPTEQQAAVERVVRAVVERYRGHPALAMWQVENEPFLRIFGECPKVDAADLAREVALVRSLDPRSDVLITDSGELSFWLRAPRYGDRFGTTMYRVVWVPFIGYWSYDTFIPPAFYRLKAFLARVPSDFMVIAELQAEPWVPQGRLADLPPAMRRRSMDAARLRQHLAFARATGFREVYLWGAEYWYWLKEHGDPSLWNAAREALTVFH